MSVVGEIILLTLLIVIAIDIASIANSLRKITGKEVK